MLAPLKAPTIGFELKLARFNPVTFVKLYVLVVLLPNNNPLAGMFPDGVKFNKKLILLAGILVANSPLVEVKFAVALILNVTPLLLM